MGTNRGQNQHKMQQSKGSGSGTSKSSRARAAKRKKPSDVSSAETSFEHHDVDENDPRVLRDFKQLDQSKGMEDMLQQMHLSNHVSTYRLRLELSSFRAEVGARFAKVEERVDALETDVGDIEEQLEEFGKELKSLKHGRGPMSNFSICNNNVEDKRFRVQKLLEGARKLREDTISMKNSLVFGRIKSRDADVAGAGEGAMETVESVGVDEGSGGGTGKPVKVEMEVREFLDGMQLGGKYNLTPRARDGSVVLVSFNNEADMSGLVIAQRVFDCRASLRQEKNLWVNFDMPEKARLGHARALKFAFAAKKELGLRFRFIEGVLILGDLVVGPEQLIPPEGKGWDLLMKMIHDAVKGSYILFDELIAPMDQTHPLILGFLLDFRMKPFDFVE